MKTPHKHAELIKVWADGAEIQVYDAINEVWRNSPTPIWDAGLKYRIKPEPKPDIVQIQSVSHLALPVNYKLNLRLTFDGETGELKSAEVLK